MDHKELRIKVLQLHYDLSKANSWTLVMRQDVGEELGIEYNSKQLLGAIKYLEDKGFLEAKTNVEDVITAMGIDEVERNFPLLGPLSTDNESTELIECLKEIDEAIKLGKEGLLKHEECSALEQKAKKVLETFLIKDTEDWRRFDKEKKKTRWKRVSSDGYISSRDTGELRFWADFIRKIVEKEGTYTKKETIIKKGDNFTARNILRKIMGKAEESMFIVDNYLDETIFDLLETYKGKNPDLDIKIITKSPKRPFKADLKLFHRQYGKIEARENNSCHDRFILIDEKELYHFGHSLKDLGKKLSSVHLVEDEEERETFIEECSKWWKKGAVVK